MPGQTTPARSLTLRSHLGADRHPTLSLSQLWFGLFKGSPVAGGVEPNGTGAYTRIAKDNDLTLWGAMTAATVSVSNSGSAGAIVWPSATGLYSITDPLDWWGAFDLSAGGTLWYYGQLQQAIQVTQAGDIPRIPVGTLTLTQPA